MSLKKIFPVCEPRTNLLVGGLDPLLLDGDPLEYLHGGVGDGDPALLPVTHLIHRVHDLAHVVLGARPRLGAERAGHVDDRGKGILTSHGILTN